MPEFIPPISNHSPTEPPAQKKIGTLGSRWVVSIDIKGTVSYICLTLFQRILRALRVRYSDTRLSKIKKNYSIEKLNFTPLIRQSSRLSLSERDRKVIQVFFRSLCPSEAEYQKIIQLYQEQLSPSESLGLEASNKTRFLANFFLDNTFIQSNQSALPFGFNYKQAANIMQRGIERVLRQETNSILDSKFTLDSKTKDVLATVLEGLNSSQKTLFSLLDRKRLEELKDWDAELQSKELFDDSWIAFSHLIKQRKDALEKEEQLLTSSGNSSIDDYLQLQDMLQIYTNLVGASPFQIRNRNSIKAATSSLSYLSEPNDTLFLSGTKTHAILVNLIKQPDGNYTLRVYNSGNGLEYHRKSNGKYLLFREFINIPKENISPKHLQELHLAEITPETSDTKPVEQFYKALNSLTQGGICTDENYSLEYFQTQQQSGTCTFQSLEAYIHHKILGAFEDPQKGKIEYKKFKALLRDVFLNHLPDTNQKARSITPVLLQQGDQTASSVNKELTDDTSLLSRAKIHVLSKKRYQDFEEIVSDPLKFTDFQKAYVLEAGNRSIERSVESLNQCSENLAYQWIEEGLSLDDILKKDPKLNHAKVLFQKKWHKLEQIYALLPKLQSHLSVIDDLLALHLPETALRICCCLFKRNPDNPETHHFECRVAGALLKALMLKYENSQPPLSESKAYLEAIQLEQEYINSLRS